MRVFNDRQLVLLGATEEENGKLIDIPPEEMKKAFMDHIPLFRFFSSIENGLIHLTLNDYMALPAPVKDAWAIWKRERNKGQ